MLFEHERRQLLGDQYRHRLPLRQRHEFLLALALEHPPIGVLGSLSPPLPKSSLLAVHGKPLNRLGFQVSCKPPHFNQLSPAQKRECTQPHSRSCLSTSIVLRFGE
jgi:hypothetical protein